MLKRQLYGAVAIAIAIAVCMSFAATASIAAADRLRYGDFHKGLYGETFRFVSLPARELMTAQEFEDYTRALHQYFCEAAQKILYSAFMRTYSSIYPEIDQSETGLLRSADPWKDHNWAFYARHRFPDYGYCQTFRALLKVEEQIRKAGIRSPAFKLTPALLSLRLKQRRAHYQHPLIEHRDMLILSIIRIAQRGYAPAVFRLLELGRRNGALELPIAIEYFLRTRLRHLDSKYSAAEGRLKQLSMSLSEPDREMLQRLATSGEKPPLMEKFLKQRRLLHER